MQTRFFYNAHAVGLAGHITLPFNHLIESQAPSALSTGGGFSTNRVCNFNYKNIVSFRSCETRVTGAYSAKDNAFFTVVESVVEDLNILGVIRVERLVGGLMSKHPAKAINPGVPYAEPEPEYAEPSIVPIGSSFEGLRVAGASIDVKLDIQKFVDHPTCSQLRENNAKAFDLRKFLGHPKEPRAPIYTTLVDRLEVGGRELDNERARSVGFRIDNGDLVSEQLGRVRLAQFIVFPDSRRFAMLEVHLGCGHEGNVMASNGEGNGIPMPPSSTTSP